ALLPLLLHCLHIRIVAIIDLTMSIMRLSSRRLPWLSRGHPCTSTSSMGLGGLDYRHDAGADGFGQAVPGGVDLGKIGVGLTGVVEHRRINRRPLMGLGLTQTLDRSISCGVGAVIGFPVLKTGPGTSHGNAPFGLGKCQNATISVGTPVF